VPVARETLFSFLSRLAAVNGVSATDFCLDMGMSLKRAVGLEPEVIERIGDLGGLTPDALSTMLSWTGERVGDVRTKLRGEVFVSRAVRNPLVRGCPVCLREDAKVHRGAPVEAMAMRGDWQLREASLCLRHDHPLVPLWEETAVTQRHNTGARLAEVQAAILSGRLDQPREEASPYDLWLDRRLDDGADPTWLAGQSLYAATTICRLLGMELLRIERRGQDEVQSSGEGGSAGGGHFGSALRAAQAKGFEVLQYGESAIRAALGRLVAAAPSAQAEPQKAFGPLFVKLSRDHAGDPAFDPVRQILRDCILDIWPVAPGEVVLGELLRERRLHSLRTAEIETGVGASILARHLVGAGALAPDDNRPDSRRTFDAQVHAGLLAEIAALVDSKAMREAMGATSGELASLAADGVLRPWSQDALVKARWRLADGLALVSDVGGRAEPVALDALGWERLQQARKRTRLGLDALIGAIRSRLLPTGRIGAGQGEGATYPGEGYHNLVVLKAAVDAIALEFRLQAEPRVVAAPGTMSAARFGRSVGLRDHGRFLALADAGQVPTLLVTYPTTGRPQHRVTEAHMAAFHRRFVTIQTLAMETGLHRNTVRMRLAAGRMSPFALDGQDFGLIYLRDEAKRLFPEIHRAAHPGAPA
jgi:hypothetical protein